MQVGEEWIYRVRDDAPSERVRIVGVQPTKTSSRFEVHFLEGPRTGQRENVPANRLRELWSNVEQYDALMANWARLDRSTLTDIEEAAVTRVFSLLIPDEGVAELMWKPVRHATEVLDSAALEPIIGVPVTAVADRVESFDRDGTPMLSPEGTLLVAEYACRVAPMPVLDWMLQDEVECRQRCKRGAKFTSMLDKEEHTSSPEWEYEWYRQHHRPLHELLRQWCGHRAITMHERLAAAEAEAHRLDVLVANLIDSLRQHNASTFADMFERRYEDERITPYSIRPVVDRPLKAGEIPVHYERAPRRWGH